MGTSLGPWGRYWGHGDVTGAMGTSLGLVVAMKTSLGVMGTSLG